MTITWSPPQNTGGLPIIKYWVISEDPSYTLSPALSTGLVTTYTLNVVQPGNEGLAFKFKVAAENLLGIGEYSDDITLIAVDAPNTPALSYTSRTLTSIILKFTPDTENGGSVITGYLLYKD